MKERYFTKNYLEDCYRLAVLDYQTAKDEAGQQKAQADLARIYNLASQIIGFDFADNLQAEYPCS